MKKLLLLTFIALIFISLPAQNATTYLNESFNGSSMPSGWTIMGLNNGNWSISNSSHAGGSPRELELYGEPQFVGISRFVSPAVDLTGVSSIEFTFKHCLDNFKGTHTLGIATSSDNGATWHDAWTEMYGEDGQYTVSQTVTTEDMGNANVRFCIYFSGDVYDVDYWYFDDISAFTMNNLEAVLTEITIPENIAVGDTPVSFIVENHGSDGITSIEANYQFENHDVITETFTTDIAPLETEALNFAIPTYLIPGTYNLTVNIVKINGMDDSDPSNNTLSKNVFVTYGTAQKIPMIEHLSSSTCNPCVAVNEDMAVLTANNPGKFTYTKYPTNWPGSGDPYNTDESDVRTSYYGVSGVPKIFVDGTINTDGAAVSQELLDQQFNTPSLAEIRGSFNVEGNNINVIVDAMGYVDFNDIKLYVAANEKTTTGNTGSNGETEFHHIMMKMFENASGNNIDIAGGSYTRLEFTYNMSSTHVEEMNDLEVAAWLQKYNTKEVFNSHFLYENVAHPYPVENLILVENEGNTMTASWDAPQGENATGYNVYVNSVLVAENIGGLSYTFEYQSGEYNIVEVCAVYGEDMTSVRAVAGKLHVLNINEKDEISCNIFPNPAKDFVKVVAKDKIQNISIFNCIGALIDKIDVDANNIEISTEKYNTGVYFINVMQENGISGTKKMVVVH